MKAIRISFMIIMVAVSVFFIVQAKIQTRVAEEALNKAAQQKQLATENMAFSLTQEKVAKEKAAEAVAAKNKAKSLQQQLDECLKN